MMCYVLSELRVITEEYREMQHFVKDSRTEELQEVLDGMITDLFHLYYGIKKD